MAYEEELLDCQGDKTLARITELSCWDSFRGELQEENRHLPALESLDI